MKQSWWHPWILVLCLLAALVLLGMIRRPLQIPGAGLPRPERVRLAGLTNDTFRKLMETATAAARMPEAGTSEDGLMRCQSALLGLKAEEERLGQSGCEVRICEGVEAWLSAGEGLPGSSPAALYLESLLDWTRRISKGGEPGQVERLMVLPGPDFPHIAFEMSGPAGWIGSNVISLEAVSPCWQLMEIDLHRPNAAGIWWTRGSLAFSSPELD